MTDSMYIKALKPAELTDMYIAFLDSFSDYPVPFNLTKEQFVRKFVQKLKIDFGLSCGAYHYDGSLAGFIFTTVSYYKGKQTAYNGGTGVRPLYRGNKLTTQMYEYLIPLLKKHSVSQCVLEVLTSNEKAIKAYSAIGFEKSNYYKCFVLTSSTLQVNLEMSPNIQLIKVSRPNWSRYEKFWDYAPSFLDSSSMIQLNLANETIVEARINDECVGYVIFQPSFGRLSQIGVHHDYRKQGIGEALIHFVREHSIQKKISIINVSIDTDTTTTFFEKLGFENQIDQYEMTLAL